MVSTRLAAFGSPVSSSKVGSPVSKALTGVEITLDTALNDRTIAALLLTEVHIRAGEPQGLTLAHQAIEGVSTLHSIAARRQRLIPLATALDARPSTDTRELARIARQIAET